MSLQDLYHPVQSELYEMEQLIQETVRDLDNPKLHPISEIVLNSPGKRLRPALTLLVGQAFQLTEPSPLFRKNLIAIATAVELIHMASLVHDDVMDESDMRHHKPTLNAHSGIDTSIAYGDYLFGSAYALAHQSGDIALHGLMSQAIREMCQGELKQICERNNLGLTKEEYFVIIRKKTASLFATACEAGAVLSRVGPVSRSAVKQFGYSLGMAFQMIDDYLDIFSEEKALGKSLAQDLAVGKMTLPVILLLEQANEDQKKYLLDLIRHPDALGNLEALLDQFKQTNIADSIIELISVYIQKGKSKLSILGPSPYKRSLDQLVDFVLEKVLSYAV